MRPIETRGGRERKPSAHSSQPVEPRLTIHRTYKQIHIKRGPGVAMRTDGLAAYDQKPQRRFPISKLDKVSQFHLAPVRARGWWPRFLELYLCRSALEGLTAGLERAIRT